MFGKTKRLYSIFVLLSLFCTNFVQADPRCIVEVLHAISPPKQDSAVELELDVEHALKLITTTDGRVGPLFDEKTPQWFNTFVQKRFPGQNPADVRWNALSPGTQLQLLNEPRAVDFFKDRKITGLKTLDQLKLTFKRPTHFLGQTYESGTHVIDVSSALQKKVEFRSSSDVKGIKGVELHLRARQSAGRMSNDARRLLQGLNIPNVHQHVHMVSRMPIEALVENPIIQSAKMGDFFRRSNLASEMITIIQDGRSIRSNIKKDLIFFDSLSAQRLEGVTQYFLDASKNQAKPIGDQFKMGWVGMRGSDAYDEPGLWGLEFRAIPRNPDEKTYSTILNAMQTTMRQPNFGLPKDQIEKWLFRRMDPATMKSSLRNSWYNREWNQLFDQAPVEIRSELSGLSGWLKKSSLRSQSKDRHEIKMLVHDWSRDPLVFSHPEFKKKIIEEQQQALQRLLKKEEDTNEIMSEFLIRSGLFEEVMNSVGATIK